MFSNVLFTTSLNLIIEKFSYFSLLFEIFDNIMEVSDNITENFRHNILERLLLLHQCKLPFVLIPKRDPLFRSGNTLLLQRQTKD